MHFPKMLNILNNIIIDYINIITISSRDKQNINFKLNAADKKCARM